MHRVTLPDGTRRKDSILKWTRVSAYAFMAAAGLAALLSQTLQDAYGVTGVVMGVFLLLGGTLSSAGALTERWPGEYMGLPLLSSSFGVFAVLTTFAAKGSPYLAAANFCLLTAVALGLLGRFREVTIVYRLSVHVARRGKRP